MKVLQTDGPTPDLPEELHVTKSGGQPGGCFCLIKLANSSAVKVRVLLLAPLLLPTHCVVSLVSVLCYHLQLTR